MEGAGQVWVLVPRLCDARMRIRDHYKGDSRSALSAPFLHNLLLNELTCFPSDHEGANPDLKRKLAVEVPSVCVLSVGGNDLDHAGPPQTLLVGMRLYELAKELISMGVNRVVVCQVVRRHRWRHLSYDEGSARVAEINEFLKAVCTDFPISFWAYKGFWNIQREIFRPDGVHFNDLGNHKLFRTIKGAVFTTVKPLRK